MLLPQGHKQLYNGKYEGLPWDARVRSTIIMDILPIVLPYDFNTTKCLKHLRDNHNEMYVLYQQFKELQMQAVVDYLNNNTTTQETGNTPLLLVGGNSRASCEPNIMSSFSIKAVYDFQSH